MKQMLLIDCFFLDAGIADPFVSIVEPITSYGMPAFNIGKLILVASTVFLFILAIYKTVLGEARNAIILLGIGLLCLSIYGGMSAFF